MTALAHVKIAENGMSIKESVVPHSRTADGPTSALPQAYFTSPEWHQRDLDLVFKRRWLYVDHSSRLAHAGDFIVYEVEKESVLVTRDADRRIHAFHNTCRHRGARICAKASGNAKAFTCPNHAWTYGLDGRLKSASHLPDLDKSLYSTVPVWVEEWNGLIFINLAEEKPRPVAEHLRDADIGRYALDRTKVIFERTYVVNANWKVCAETFNECYHCAVAHPKWCKLIDPLKHLEAFDGANTAHNGTGADDDFVTYTNDIRNSVIDPSTRTFTMDGRVACTKPLGNDVNWHEEMSGLSWYPQFGMYLFPDHAYVSSWKPVAVDKTLYRTVWMVHEDAVEGRDYEVEKVVALVNLVNEEDTRVCENAQRGIESSGYRPGPYHPVFEAPVRAFNKVYLSQVGADPQGGKAG
jgi:Rieske 2Fe-2S family protein